MTDKKYSKFSNYTKFIILLVAGLLGLVQYKFTEISLLFFSSILGFLMMTIVIITIIDKSHKTISSQLNLLQDTFKLKFEYQGIIDSVKDRFTVNEMQELWPILMLKVKKEFTALNYLSKESWDSGGGDSLVILLGIRMEIERINSRRLFVIENIEEYDLWKDTFDLHKKYNINSKYILQSRYNEIIKTFSKTNKTYLDIKGFNVLDPETAGIVVDWIYKKRETSGAILKKGSSNSKVYMQLFDKLWFSSETIF